ncbi:Alpha 1,4-glycosyltransferase domain containing protein [Trema orientale]|uniref:Alpha 1,4-glycosyltransferase domain containing protein n=1 Tax=Trema orientale TaxID=63057 RepID=A0A2P5F4C5_TREOI|nr:Alpha 1,4-glycosyltransferase domain containing protein [Trema orientale]
MEKKLSQKVLFRLFSRTAKSPIFFAMTFGAIFFMIYTDSIVSNLNIYPLDLTTYEIYESQDVFAGIDNNNNALVPKVDDDRDDIEIENRDNIVPPENITKEERIVWFHRKLFESEILESNDLSLKFHSRVLEFLNHGCSIQLYMTWIAPAKEFGKRQFLSIDTLFKAHPKGCLMILSRTMDTKRGYRILKPLIDRGFKVLAITPDVSFLLKNTPAEPWLESMKNGDRDPGFVPFPQNLSNLLRIAVLYKYGGAYLDTDFLVLRDFLGLRNAVGAQSIDAKTKQWTRLNNAVLIFDINHPILLDFMEDFAENFNGNRWGYNGPYMVSRVVESVGSKAGYNLTILPPKAFYPVNWVEMKKLMKRPGNESESRWVESMLNEFNEGETYGVHLWNKSSKDLDIEEGSVVAKLVSDHCVVCQDIYTSNN